MTRNKALEIIKGLPKEFNVDDFIGKMLFIDKVGKGFKCLENGKYFSNKSLKNDTFTKSTK